MTGKRVSVDTPATSPEKAAMEILACVNGKRQGREGRMYDFNPQEKQGRSSTTA